MKYKLTAPHAGDFDIAFDYLFSSLGYEFIAPPKSSRRSLDLGVKYAPSQACFPFKVTLGNLVEGLEDGANVVAMIGGRTGICRLAYYADMYEKVLNNCGYDFERLPIKLKKETWSAIKSHCPKLSFFKFLKICYIFWLKMKLLELLREKLLIHRPREMKNGETLEVYKYFKEEVRRTNNIKELKILRKNVFKKFSMLPQSSTRKIVKIGVVGEFFLLLDQFASMNIEEMLGELGAEVDISDKFSEFFVGSVKQIRWLDNFLPTERRKINKYAKPFLNRPIGGHAVQCLGYTVDYAKRGYDGVVLLYPFTCMPQISANAIIHEVSKKYNIPVLTLCLDEQTGKAGVSTRLEAFVDMIRRKGDKK